MTIPLRLLIAMNSEDDALLIVRQLQHAGYDPAGIVSIRQQLSRRSLPRSPWDAVLSDYTISGFGGLEALAMVRQKTGTSLHSRFGRDRREAAVESIKAGAGDCILRDRLDRLPAAVDRELRDFERRRSHVCG